jgi:hypothetical protein
LISIGTMLHTSPGKNHIRNSPHAAPREFQAAVTILRSAIDMDYRFRT